MTRLAGPTDVCRPKARPLRHSSRDDAYAWLYRAHTGRNHG